MEQFEMTFEEARMSRAPMSGEKFIAVEVMHCVPMRKGGLAWTKKSSHRLTPTLWACSNATPNRNHFPKISPGEFFETSAMQKGCHLG
jgi:hypothetical protein